MSETLVRVSRDADVLAQSAAARLVVRLLDAQAERGLASVVLTGGRTAEQIYHAIREQKGKIDGDKTVALLKGYKIDNSPRGPIMIDPETRDVVQNEYLRRVERVGGNLANVELETIPMVKDPWKEINKKK